MRVVRPVWAELNQGEALLVVLATAGLILLTADVAVGGLAADADAQLADALAARPEPSAGDRGESVWSVSGLGELGLSGGVLTIIVLVTVQATFRVWPLLLALGDVGGGLLLVLALKVATGRPGPGASSLPEDYPGFFPSGHVATAGLCLGTACFMLLRWRGYLADRVTPGTAGLVVGIGAAALVGVGTVVGGHHWVTDAVGSVLITALVLPLGFAACSAYAAGP